MSDVYSGLAESDRNLRALSVVCNHGLNERMHSLPIENAALRVQTNELNTFHSKWLEMYVNYSIDSDERVFLCHPNAKDEDDNKCILCGADSSKVRSEAFQAYSGEDVRVFTICASRGHSCWDTFETLFGDEPGWVITTLKIHPEEENPEYHCDCEGSWKFEID